MQDNSEAVPNVDTRNALTSTGIEAGVPKSSEVEVEFRLSLAFPSIFSTKR